MHVNRGTCHSSRSYLSVDTNVVTSCMNEPSLKSQPQQRQCIRESKLHLERLSSSSWMTGDCESPSLPLILKTSNRAASATRMLSCTIAMLAPRSSIVKLPLLNRILNHCHSFSLITLSASSKWPEITTACMYSEDKVTGCAWAARQITPAGNNALFPGEREAHQLTICRDAECSGVQGWIRGSCNKSCVV